MKASRHNGRSGKHGVYDVKHNDRDFDVENSEHIDPERTKENVYWDCYQGYSFAGSSQERQFTFTEVERAYYFEHYSDHVDAQNERNEMARHPERNRTIDDVLKNNKTCPEETVLQLGNIDETVSADVLAKVVAEYFEEFNKRYGSHVHILDWALHMDESTPHIHERHVFDAKKGCKEAQFQLGYKGYIQLATRSGQYKKLNVLAIKEGELIRFDPMDEEIEVNMIEDDEIREQTPTIGYYAMFEYVNGFRKAMYWSKKKMAAHAEKYSFAFGRNGGMKTLAKIEAGEIPEKDLWKYSSFWFKDFDGMAYKTMLRQLISKWGIMSIDMMTAMDSDMAVINDDGTHTYVESDAGTVVSEADYKEADETDDLPKANPSSVPDASLETGTQASFFD